MLMKIGRMSAHDESDEAADELSSAVVFVTFAACHCPPPSSWPLQRESLRETLVRILNRPRRDTNEVGEIEAAVA